MTCLISRPNPQVLFDQYKNMFSANVLGGAPVVPESNEWYVVALNYAMAEEFYAISEQYWKERDPRYACCDNLIKMASNDGVVPYPARYATGYVIITGIPGSPLPSRIQITATNGRNYATIGNIPTSMGTEGALTLRVQDTQPGPDGNSAGVVTTATLSNPIVGIDDAVTICGGSLCGGKLGEDCETFRTRYIARKQYQPRATQAWAIEKLLEWDCVTRVIPRAGSCCRCGEGTDCECQTCGGTLDFYVMFDNSFPCGIAPQNVLDEVSGWFFGETQGYGQGQVEIGVCGSIALPKSFMVDVRVDIVGCPTIAQLASIRARITDLMSLVNPSEPLRAKQISLVVAGVIGASIDSDVIFVPVTPDESKVHVTACGDLEPECDYMPCLNEIYFTGPAVATGTCT
jgi:hypothetical protein